MPGSLLARALGTVRGGRRGLTKFGFRLRSPLIQDVAFATAGGLKLSTETIKYRAGGALVPIKTPGLSDFEPFTASRAAVVNVNDLYDWKRLVVAADIAGSASIGSPQGLGINLGYMSTIDVIETGRDHTGRRAHRLVNAWPNEFSPHMGFEANTSDFNMTEMSWEYDFFILTDPRTGGRVSFSVFGTPFGVPIQGTLDGNGFSLNPSRINSA